MWDSNTKRPPLSTKWDPSHRRLIITIEADVAAYGQTKASVTSGHVNIGDQKVELTNLGGDVKNVGTWDDPNDVTSLKYTPIHKAYFECPKDVESDSYTYSASGKVEISGVYWEGTGTISITSTVGVSVGLDISGTYQVSTGVSESVTGDVSGNTSDSFRNHTDVTWTVAHSTLCGHVQCWKSITDPHAHHWWCWVNENGCGDHIKCKDYIPAEHVIHEKCWNHTHGCEETDVRRCTHECAFAGVFLNGTDFNVNDTLTVKVVRKNLGATTVYFKKPGDTGEFGVRVASSGTPDGNGIEDDLMVFNITFSEEDVGTFTMNIHIFEEGNYLDVVEWWVAQITVINVENGSSSDDDGLCGDETIWGTTYGTSGCGNPRNENSCTHPYIVDHYTIMWCEDCNQYYR